MYKTLITDEGSIIHTEEYKIVYKQFLTGTMYNKFLKALFNNSHKWENTKKSNPSSITPLTTIEPFIDNFINEEKKLTNLVKFLHKICDTTKNGQEYAIAYKYLSLINSDYIHKTSIKPSIIVGDTLKKRVVSLNKEEYKYHAALIRHDLILYRIQYSTKLPMLVESLDNQYKKSVYDLETGNTPLYQIYENTSTSTDRNQTSN